MAHVPELLSDSDYTSSSALSDTDDDSEGFDSESDWPIELKQLLAKKPRKRDYNKDGRFRPGSKHFIKQCDEQHEVLKAVIADVLESCNQQESCNKENQLSNKEDRKGNSVSKAAAASSSAKTTTSTKSNTASTKTTTKANTATKTSTATKTNTATKANNSTTTTSSRKTSPSNSSPPPIEKEVIREPLPETLDKINSSIQDKLSKAWKSVLDGDEGHAIKIYHDCMLLFSLLAVPHQHMDDTHIALYMLTDRQQGDIAASEPLSQLYEKIKLISTDIPFLHYIHFKHNQRVSCTTKECLEFFRKLNKAVLSSSWSSFYYPLSRQTIPESSSEHVTKELRKYVTGIKQHSGKDMIAKCVGADCPNPGLYIVDSVLVSDVYNVLECNERCRQHYHPACYKLLPKWAPSDPCFTPDCTGHIVRLYEDGKLKREAKVSQKKDKGKPVQQPPSSPRNKKKTQRKRTDTGNSTKENITSPREPSPAPPVETPKQVPSGDDMVDMFGTMLIYIEEYPNTHITTITMYMNSVYSWVKVDIIYQFIEDGVQSFTTSNEGIVNMVSGTTEEKELRKEEDILLLINKYKTISPTRAPYKNTLDKAPPSAKAATKGSASLNHSTKSWSEIAGAATRIPETTKGTSSSNIGALSTPTIGAPLPNAGSKKANTLNPGATEFSFPKPMNVPTSSTSFQSPTVYLKESAKSNYLPGFSAVSTVGAAIPRPENAYKQIPLNEPVELNAYKKITLNEPAELNKISFPERKALAEKMAAMEQRMEDMKTKYEKEISHYKTQLCEQMDVFHKLKAKTKLYKQDYKIAVERAEDQTQLQQKYEKLLSQIEEERKAWLSERESKSVEAKKLILKFRIELEEKKKANDEANSTIIQKNRETEELQEKLHSCEKKVYTKEQEVMELRRTNIDITQNYKLTQQHLVQEQYNVSQLKLRIAYANCEAQIRERQNVIPLYAEPGGYHLPQWRLCQEQCRTKIDDNRLRYDEYVDALHNSRETAMVRFEQEPPCPPGDVGVVPIPLQRYDDILEGREAPPLPKSVPDAPVIADNELDVLASLMNEVSACPSPLDSLPPPTPLSTISPTNNHLHFEIEETPEINTTSPRLPAETPGAAHFDLSEFMRPILSSETRAPGTTIPPPGTTRPPAGRSRSPTNSGTSRPPSNVSDNLLPASLPIQEHRAVSNRGRGRSRSRGPSAPSAPPGAGRDPSAPSTPPAAGRGPSVPSVPPAASRVPGSVPGARGIPIPRPNQIGVQRTPDLPNSTAPHAAPPARPPQNKGAMLKSKIKENHPHLSDGEVNLYLRKVRDSTNLAKATPQFVLDRIRALVAIDYPSPGEVPLPSDQNTCVICTDALSLHPVTILGCGHSFHADCVNTWFRQNHTCPTCRSHQPPIDMFPPLS